ncbi:VOC family protein [Georgenia sp. MJ173]|uniref:VOC family protein n=1 Tax=Georgenia sunbinii TaxID=3117728 RepID=UPI002F268D17
MAVTLNPYLSFREDARQALEFYHSVFGGSLTISTFGDAMPGGPAAEAGKVMHGQLDGESGIVLMASDTPEAVPYQTGSDISISLSGDDGDTLRGYWEALIDGGTVVEPLVVAPWGDHFGMCTDRFGTHWMVSIAAEAA